MISEFEQLLRSVRLGEARICSDSRALKSGDVFVAVPGVNVDGAAYIEEAIRRGATAVVCDSRAYAVARGQADRLACKCCILPQSDVRQAFGRLAAAQFHTEDTPLAIVGITGTNGKTTTAFLLEHLFTALGQKTGVLGTVSYRWPGHSEAAPLTTPDPIKLHSMLNRMQQSGVRMVIMEASSHAIAQQRIAGVEFSGVAFTNLTQDHLDFHHDMESYFQTKASLFRDAPRHDKIMAINMDDPWGQRLGEENPKAMGFGLQGVGRREGFCLGGAVLKSDMNGCHLRMHLQENTWDLHSPLVGAFNASNLLAAQALALQLGVEIADLRALESFRGVCGRLERISNPAGLHIFVDYAHTPDALINVLRSLRGAGFHKIITIFGCGGNRDRTKRPLMGEAVAKYSDVAIVTSDNPRHEDPDAIISDILPGLVNADQIVIEPDRRAATQHALSMLKPDEALLIAGKGHENYQIIGDVKHHYSDQEVVREFLHCA